LSISFRFFLMRMRAASINVFSPPPCNASVSFRLLFPPPAVPPFLTRCPPFFWCFLSDSFFFYFGHAALMDGPSTAFCAQNPLLLFSPSFTDRHSPSVFRVFCGGRNLSDTLVIVVLYFFLDFLVVHPTRCNAPSVKISIIFRFSPPLPFFSFAKSFDFQLLSLLECFFSPAIAPFPSNAGNWSFFSDQSPPPLLCVEQNHLLLPFFGAPFNSSFPSTITNWDLLLPKAAGRVKSHHLVS